MKNKLFVLCVIACFLYACMGEKKHYVLIETEFGDMKVELYNETPYHRDNFLSLVKDGFYDDLLFHRVIQNFMIQGGDPQSKNAPPNQPLGNGGPGYTLPQEIGAPHFKGTLAAARTPDTVNPEKKSSGSQFYIVQGQKQNRATLDAIAASKGFQYNEAQIQKYMDVGGTPGLDQDYTVFGEVVEGFDVIDKIAAVPRSPADRPLQDVKMKIRITR